MLQLTQRLLLTIIFFSFSSHTIARDYKNLQPLTDEEALSISLDGKKTFLDEDEIEQEKYSLLPPISDYLELNDSKKWLLDSCLEQRAKLIMTGNTKNFKNVCLDAFEKGVIDAGFILGSDLINGLWLSHETELGLSLINKASQNGSRLAKRFLVSYLTDPTNPKNDYPTALALAKELESTEKEWDIIMSASLHAAHGTREEAQTYFNLLISMASKGFSLATIRATTIKIQYGYLHDLDKAKQLFEHHDLSRHPTYSFLPALIFIMEDKLIDAKEQLAQCHTLNSTCNALYLKFITYGIGGEIDLEKANTILEQAYAKWPKNLANQYAWIKATASQAPLYNPLSALLAIQDIPKSLHDIPYIKDTIAAVHAANGDYEKAFSLQNELTSMITDNALSARYKHHHSKLKHYQDNKRWIEPTNIDELLANIKGFSSIINIEKELTSL